MTCTDVFFCIRTTGLLLFFIHLYKNNTYIMSTLVHGVLVVHTNHTRRVWVLARRRAYEMRYYVSIVTLYCVHMHIIIIYIYIYIYFISMYNTCRSRFHRVSFHPLGRRKDNAVERHVTRTNVRSKPRDEHTVVSVHCQYFC
jgi:hypothetical protein